MDSVNEDLMRFLDADEYEDKLRILEEIKDRADDHVVNMMAASLSISAGGATREECIGRIRHYLTLQIQYDGKRLRN
ncbi:MAG: hypothetical protein J5966_01550 [Lachnospiraceae bacterium]|nr:hypothetical protein [Lachnospiraceae bacterium]